MFYDTFSMLCSQRGVTPNKVLVDCKISRTSAAKWKKGAVPNGTTLSKLAEYFGVTADFLLTGKAGEKPLINEDESLTDYLEELKNRPEMRMLFSLAKGATKEDVEKAVAIIEALRRSESGED